MVVLSDIKEIIKNKDLVSFFDKKSILITGASGLIGSMLIKVFDFANTEYDLNIDITGLARDEEKAKSILGDVIDKITIIYSDAFEVEGEYDYIIHTASPTRSSFFVNYPVETIEAIVFGTKNMLELAKSNNSTFVYISSMEEYGVPYINGEIMTEDKVGVVDHLNTRACYPESKRMCECMCVAYNSEHDLDTRIVRLAQTFGAGMPLTDNRVSMQFAKSVIENKNIVLHTEGKSISNFCYLTDALVAILTIIVRGQKGEVYNVCNDDETRSIYDIAKLVASEVANGKIDVEINISENKGYAPDNTMRLSSKKLNGLGWIPKVSMVDGYKRIVCYIKEEMLL